MEMSVQIHIPLPMCEGRCGEEMNLIFLPGHILWFVWLIDYPIFSFISNVY